MITLKIDIPHPTEDYRIEATVEGIHYPDAGNGAEFELLFIDGIKPDYSDPVAMEAVELECLRQIEGGKP